MDEINNSPEIKVTDPVESVRQKYDNILSLVIIVLFVGFVTLLVAVMGLVIDAWNSKTVYYQSFEEQQQLSNQQQELLQKLNTIDQSATTTKK